MTEQFEDDGCQYNHHEALPEIYELDTELFDDEKNNSGLGKELKMGIAYTQFYGLQAVYRRDRELEAFRQLRAQMEEEEEEKKQRAEQEAKEEAERLEQERLKEEKKAQRKERIRNFFRCKC